MLDRESLAVNVGTELWPLCYRRLEARGEIRGGYFIAGVSVRINNSRCRGSRS
jgi:hypothetical protein